MSALIGVVTSAEPSWGGRFFVQDSTGGVFVENISDHQPQPGDVVQVSGVSHPGAFAPIITKPRWEKIGVAPLPPARDVRIEQLMAGVEDGQRVEVTGVVRDASTGEPIANHRMGIASGSGYASAQTDSRPTVVPICSPVQIRPSLDRIAAATMCQNGR